VDSFVLEIDKINEQGGLDTEHGKLKILLSTASLDSIARPKLQNHIQFNGYCGCTYCYTKGEFIGGSMKYPTRYDIFLK
jgi:hypothetical protein